MGKSQKPKWWRYRSSKWFELMMLQAAISSLNGEYCPFCYAFGEVCSRCIMDSAVGICCETHFVDVYGVEWWEAYPELYCEHAQNTA